MKNPYMKFQNPSMHCSEVLLGIKKRNGRMDAWTDAHTHKRRRNNMPLQLLQSWGHNNTGISDELRLIGLHNCNWVTPCKNVSSCICGQGRPRSACRTMQFDQVPLTESLDTTECMNGEQMPGWYFVQMQDNLNLLMDVQMDLGLGPVVQS